MSEEEDQGMAQDEPSPSEEELRADEKRKKDALKPKLKSSPGKKTAKPGRFHKNLLPLVKRIDSRADPEVIVALSRCLDVMAESIAEACAAFAKPIPEDDAGYEPQMLTGVLAFNAVMARIPEPQHDRVSEAVHGHLDRYWGVDSTAGDPQ